MRRMTLMLLAGALLLSGCASMGPNPALANIDTLKVARVEAAAKAVGVQVFWMNYPQKASAQLN